MRSKEENNNNDGILKEHLSLCKRAFSYNLLFSLLINILMLSTSIYSLQILDRVLSSGSMETLLMLSIIMIVVYIILAILQTVRSLIFTQISNWLDLKLSGILLESSIDFESETRGSQNLRDLSTIKSFITSQSLIHLFDAPWAIVYFMVIFFIHWILGIIVVVGAIALLLLALLNERLTKKESERANEINIISMNKVDSVARNCEVIKAMGMKENIAKSWQEINQELVKKNTIVQVRSGTISSITKSVRLLIQMSTMAIGAILVIKAKMSAGGIIATSILSGKALMPFDAAVSIYKSLINGKKSYQRLTKSLENYEDTKEQKIKLPEPKGKLQLENIIYKLPKSDQIIIKDISLEINAGEIIGVIGASGSGKTTLARLIVGVLKQNKGKIRIDGAEVKNQDSKEIGKYIGYLPQDVELFDATIKENIARMDKEANDEDIINASKFAGTHDLILSLPKGYETNANSLSAGQRQRVALARAFFGMPKLVILDEPNSNLDTDGENHLIKTLQNARASKITTIIISHKPMILGFMDKILLLHAGEAKIFDEAKKVMQGLAPKGKVLKRSSATKRKEES